MLTDIHAFLGSETPAAWVDAACENIDLLLLDHKNCEYKAASNAINLMAKYQERIELINAMSRLAREELVHYEQVLKIIKARGIALRPISASRYAASLRSLVRRDERGMMTDILIISALSRRARASGSAPWPLVSMPSCQNSIRDCWPARRGISRDI